MFGNALVEMVAGVTNLVCTTQMTFITLNNALLADQGWLFFLCLEFAANFELS